MKSVASELLRIQAVFLSPKEPFTWASGIKSPIYCDNRLILSDVEARNYLENSFAKMLKEKYPNVEMIMGTATAGIAHAAIVADILGLPMGYVRSSNKSHGRENVIEGRFEKGAKIVVIEDLISTASSSIKAAESLRENGAEVLGIASIFTYNMKKAEDNLNKANLSNHSLSNLDLLLDVAVNRDYITDTEKEQIIKFRNNPDDESWIK